MSMNKGSLPKSDDLFECVPTTTETRKFGCGHEHAKDFDFIFYGIGYKYDATTSDKCGVCVLEEMRSKVIRCGDCGRPIMPGDPVAGYVIDPDKPPNPAWVHTDENGGYLGCLSMDCCPSGGAYMGNWDGERVIPHKFLWP